MVVGRQNQKKARKMLISCTYCDHNDMIYCRFDSHNRTETGAARMDDTDRAADRAAAQRRPRLRRLARQGPRGRARHGAEPHGAARRQRHHRRLHRAAEAGRRRAAHARLHDGGGGGQPGRRRSSRRCAGSRRSRRSTAPTGAGTSSPSCAPTASRALTGSSRASASSRASRRPRPACCCRRSSSERRPLSDGQRPRLGPVEDQQAVLEAPLSQPRVASDPGSESPR